LARNACSLPLLCKEFVLDEIQLDYARAFGADLVLLIARYLDPDVLVGLHGAAIERNLTPLVEIATLEEARWIRQLDVPVVGVNARDLDTLALDASRARSVLESLDVSLSRIHLSGLKTPRDVANTRELGVDGALIGEVLMREANPEPLLRRLVEAASPQNCQF
jgi:indole-3-glycerol phosphate synthase